MQDTSKFGVSICTVDGQRFNYGHSDFGFCMQGCVQPFMYAVAMEEVGSEQVHKHVGCVVQLREWLSVASVFAVLGVRATLVPAPISRCGPTATCTRFRFVC